MRTEIEIKPYLGHITDAADDMCTIARALNVRVRRDFNGTMMVANPWSSPAGVVAEWDRIRAIAQKSK